MGLKFLYFGLIIPASKLPFGVIYYVSDIVALFLNYILKYRLEIAQNNLRNAFPKLTKSEIEIIYKNNSKHLSDILLESVKNLSLSEKELKPRIVFKNTELIEKYYKEGKSVIFMGSHCNNWEYIISSQNLYFSHLAVGIGQPLTNPFFHHEINKKRERFGLKVVDATSYKEVIESNIKANKPVSVLVLADQSPPNIHRAYWGKLFGIDTPFAYGGEILARKYDMPVVYLKNTKTKRGFYEVEIVPISEHPNKEPYGGIIDKYINEMELQIKENPQYWLWTHKRWKHKAPVNLEEVKRKNIEKFNSKNADSR